MNIDRSFKECLVHIIKLRDALWYLKLEVGGDLYGLLFVYVDSKDFV